MSFYYLPAPQKYNTFKADEHYDIQEEIYEVPKGVEHLTLAELIQYPARSKKSNTMLAKCEDDERTELEPINTIAVGEIDHDCHSTTFNEIKALSPLIHEAEGLTVAIIEAMADAFKIYDGINNHSYLRCCPEQVYSFSETLRDELLMLDNTDLKWIASAWLESTKKRFEYTLDSSPKNTRWYYWEIPYDLSFYTVDYFEDLLLNMYELVRYCEGQDTLYISVDY